MGVNSANALLCDTLALSHFREACNTLSCQCRPTFWYSHDATLCFVLACFASWQSIEVSPRSSRHYSLQITEADPQPKFTYPLLSKHYLRISLNTFNSVKIRYFRAFRSSFWFRSYPNQHLQRSGTCVAQNRTSITECTIKLGASGLFVSGKKFIRFSFFFFPNSWVEIIYPVCPAKEAPENSPSGNPPPKINLPKSNPAIGEKTIHIAPLQGHVAEDSKAGHRKQRSGTSGKYFSGINRQKITGRSTLWTNAGQD